MSVYHISGTLATSYHCTKQVRTNVKPTICLYTWMEVCICPEEEILYKTK